jgi:hypothetical protein
MVASAGPPATQRTCERNGCRRALVQLAALQKIQEPVEAAK